MVAEAPAPLPARVPLNGADWFLYLMDWRMRRRTGVGCVCHLVAELDTDVTADLEARLRTLPRWLWLARLRLRALPPLRTPAWEALGETWGGPVELGDLLDEDALLGRLAMRLDVEREAPVRVSMARLGERRVVVLSWHHALLDARGAEALMSELGGVTRVVRPAMPAPVRSPMEQLWSAKKARDFIYEVSTGDLAWIDAGAAGHKDHFLRLRLTGDELAAIDAQAERVGAAMLRSALHVAATTRAVAGLLSDRGVNTGDLLVPAPQEQRTARGDVGNGLSLLFYRVPRAVVPDLAALVAHATQQVRGMIREAMPAAMTTLLDFCVWLPTWMYGPIVSFPTRGRLATFGVSDTGGSLGQLSTWQGAAVRDAWHVPANLYPPGVTFVFTRFRGAQDIVLRWRADRLTPAELDTLVGRLRADLMGDAAVAREAERV